MDEVANGLFRGWEWNTNVEFNPKIRIWIVWRCKAYQIEVYNTTEQLIHYRVVQVSTRKNFFLTFVYGLNTIT